MGNGATGHDGNGYSAVLVKLGFAALGLVQVLLLAAAGWVFSNVQGNREQLIETDGHILALEKDVALINSTQFRDSDAAELKAGLMLEVEQLVSARLAVLPQQGPPAWFVEQTNANNARLEKQLEEIDRSVDRLAQEFRQGQARQDEAIDDLEDEVRGRAGPAGRPAP